MKTMAILLLIMTVVGVGSSEIRAQVPATESTTQVAAKDPAVAPFDGGSPNKIAQLGVCKELEVVAFEQLKDVNNAAFTLLKNTHKDKAEKAYGKASVYDNAVLLNTAAAAADLGADLSSAVILKPYYSDKSGVNTGFVRLPFGYYFKGFTGIRIPPVGKKSKSDRYGIRGSVEVSTDENGDTHFDVDLYNPKSIFYAEHLEEILFNEANRRPTHPGDVAKLLFEDRKLKTGVSCKG